MLGIKVTLAIVALVLLGDALEWAANGFEPAPAERAMVPWLLGGWVL